MATKFLHGRAAGERERVDRARLERRAQSGDVRGRRRNGAVRDHLIDDRAARAERLGQDRARPLGPRQEEAAATDVAVAERGEQPLGAILGGDERGAEQPALQLRGGLGPDGGETGVRELAHVASRAPRSARRTPATPLALVNTIQS